MRYLLLAFAILGTPQAFAGTWSTVPEYQADLDAAKPCNPIDGRKVWVGSEGYYIQSWAFQTGQSGILDDETAGAVPFKDNAKSDLVGFAAACK